MCSSDLNSPESLAAVIRRFHCGLQDYGDYVNKPFIQEELALNLPAEHQPFTLLAEKTLRQTASEIFSSTAAQV